MPVKKFIPFFLVVFMFLSPCMPAHFNSVNTGGALGTDRILSVACNEKFIFAGTDRGLYIIEPAFGSIRLIDEKQGLASDMVTSLAYSKSSAKLFIGTNKGLSVYSPVHDKIRSYSAEDGLPDNDIRNVFSDDPAKKVYISTFGGKGTVFDSGDMDSASFQVYQTGGGSAETMSSLCISTYLKDRAGKIWHGTNGKGIFISDDRMEWETFGEYRLQNQWITGLAMNGSSGQVYISSTTGLLSVDPERPETITEVEAFKGIWIKHVISDGDSLLLATQDGMYLFRDGVKHDLTRKYLVRSKKINEIRLIDDTVLIATEDDGLYAISFPLPEVPVQSVEPVSESEQYDSRTLIIRYKNESDSSKVKSLAAGLGYSVKDTDSTLKAILFETKKMASLDTAVSRFEELIKQAGISATVSRNAVYRRTGSDPYYIDQKPYLDLINFEIPSASTGKSGGTVTVAVLDTGVNRHEDIRENLSSIGKSFVSNSQKDHLRDAAGHGTAVAGIIGAVANNSKGICGIAGKVEIMSVKVMDDRGRGNSWYIAKGILFAAEHGADVINLSLGGDGYCETAHQAIIYAVEEKGCAVIAAAGNNNSTKKHYPSAFPEVLSVVAVDYDGKRAEFSNYGVQADVSAPGVQILSTAGKDQYSFVYGTSFAAPVVAGLAARMKLENPGLSADQIHSYIVLSCGKDPSTDSINRTKKGWKAKKAVSSGKAVSKPDWSRELGFGVIDFKKAVELVSSYADGEKPSVSHKEMKIPRVK